MKQASAILLIAIPLLFTSDPACPQHQDPADEVVTAVASFGRAFAEADVPLLETLLAREYSHVNGRSGSLVTRGDWLKWVQSRREEIVSGELVINAYEIEDLSVTVYGEAAIATGVVHSSGTRDGVAFQSRIRFTNVWVLEAGQWRRAAFHDSPLTEDE